MCGAFIMVFIRDAFNCSNTFAPLTIINSVIQTTNGHMHTVRSNNNTEDTLHTADGTRHSALGTFTAIKVRNEKINKMLSDFTVIFVTLAMGLK